MQRFVEYARKLKGDEKGEGQLFCEHLFQAFGHENLQSAGATLEERIKGKGRGTKFADLVWRPHLLMEMKKRGEKLERHYRQAFEYWLRLVPQRPQYVVLCNFDEFWIYDLNLQLEEPVDRVVLEDLPDRYLALNFLFPENPLPQFGNDRVAVTKAAADDVARIFNSLVARGEERSFAQRFTLQCVVALFSEDVGLLPKGFFTALVHECLEGGSSYDLIGNLFRQMGSASPARGGRYTEVPYFNGGIFKTVQPVDFTPEELELLAEAASENWAKVQPQVFGTLFQSSMDRAERHAYGAHFTAEADIQKIVTPTIVRPWRERIEAADTLAELRALRRELVRFRVLDPACGAGDFLYVAYRELKRIEMDLLAKVHENFTRLTAAEVEMSSLVSPRQFFGIEKNPFGAELAKVTLALAKELALQETREMLVSRNATIPLDFDSSLPLDNLDGNILCDDALFRPWPEADAIVGNPPFQSKNKMQDEFGPAYVGRVRERYPEVSGKADFCTYWFRLAHDHLKDGERAGLVGTNTIRQNNSRESSLDYITKNGGTITEAVSTQVWSGEANVYVSIVNWIKDESPGKKLLYRQLGDRRDSDFEVVELDHIGPALSGNFDVTGAGKLKANADSPTCYQGQTHGHKGFLLTPDEAREMISASPESETIIFPYMIGKDMLDRKPPGPSRFSIDLNHCKDLFSAARIGGAAFERVRERVLPDMEMKAHGERLKTGKDSGPRQNHLKKWWKFWRGRAEMIDNISRIPRYIACSRVTKRPIFEFVDSSIQPNDALQVFPLPDDYSFGILQSDIHWLWFVERCSTLKGDFRYTSDTVFDSFPWPQSPDEEAVRRVAGAAVALRELRWDVMKRNDLSFRELYRMMELPGDNPLKAAQESLDYAVRGAYGMGRKEDPLSHLFALNGRLLQAEASGKPVAGPGLPESIADPSRYVTEDRITFEVS
ncbi:Type II restriction/modification system, DNA methylase subunit YeeA [Rubrobacter radiotolerans DSM 5868]|nr:Type II restriction/modification system, DNA methylase subunit YeeA [Rubrobacter radiotolerans DSM 5868]